MIRMYEYISLQVGLALAGVKTVREREEGQTLVEYALILSLISIGVMAAMIALRDQIGSIFTSVKNAI